MPSGVFQADRFLKACLPKFKESVPTGVFRYASSVYPLDWARAIQ